MTHPDPETLDALAYGMLEVPAAEEVRRHLEGCPRCRSAVAGIESEAAGLQAALQAPPLRRYPVLSIVAAVLAFIAVLSFFVKAPARGPQRLADGTLVEASGPVTVEGPREVRVGRGAYLFTVAEAAEMFLVRTPTAEIEVKGTTFFVEVKEEEMTRSEALVTLVAVAAGAVAVGNYFGWIDLGPSEEAVAPENEAPRITLEPDPRVATMREHLERLEREKEEIVRDAESRIVDPVVKDVRPPDPEGPEPPVVVDVEIPEGVQDAADRLVVSAGALKVAMNLDQHFRKHPYGEDPELLAVLRSYGADGFRAVLALLYGGRNGIWFRRMVEATWSPGLESDLINLANDDGVPKYSRWSALSSLAVADTPVTRDYLVRRIENEQDPGLFMSTARSLGELREPRGAAWLDDRITREGWGGVRGSILQAAGDMGGPDAVRFLLDYVRKPRAGNLSTALEALAKHEAAAAAAEARRIMAGESWRFLDRRERRAIEKIGGE